MKIFKYLMQVKVLKKPQFVSRQTDIRNKPQTTQELLKSYKAAMAMVIGFLAVGKYVDYTYTKQTVSCSSKTRIFIT